MLRYFASMPGFLDASVCRSMIYFGGQRLAKILRVTWADVGDDNSLRILETKGKRIAAWEHMLPITPRILEIMKPLTMTKIGPGPFCLGETVLGPDVFGKRFSDAGKALSEAGRTKYFTNRNIRVTCETMMAGLGITKEIRAWILSHGRRDVQGVHYDRYEYYDEKLNALILWGTCLDRLEQGQTWNEKKIVLRKKRN